MTRRASHADVERCGDVLADAFHDYPWTRWTVDGRDHESRLAELQRCAIEHLGLPFGQVWVTTVDGDVHCVAVWMDGRVPVPDAVHDRLAPRTAALEGDRHQASEAAARQLGSQRLPDRCWVLATVGTTRSMQRRGLASRTLRPMLQEADATGLDAVLETSSPSNVAFYEGLGFRAQAHCVIEGGGPDVWTMRRSPASDPSRPDVLRPRARGLPE